MTPAENYAQKHLEAVALIRAHAPARLQDALIELSRPAIALNATRADDSEIPLGASKFGGAPDVPEGFEWPTWNDKPLGFLAQINLEEVAPFDLENLLPKRGLLSFFVVNGEETPLWGDPDQKDGWRVFFWPRTHWHRIQPPADSYDLEIHLQSVKVDAKWTLPIEDEHLPSIDAVIEDLEESEELKLEDFLEIWENEKNDNWQQIFGSARPLQISPRFRAEQSARGIFHGSDEEFAQGADIWRGAENWRLLLQLDTMHWFADICYDLGTLYFMIRSA